MTYELALGDRTYSSWSLRGWLLFEKFNLPVKLHTARMYSVNFQTMLADFAPAQLVPAMKFDGIVVQDTARIEILWAMAREKFGANGPWLFGNYTIADAFYAPVATRFATFNLPRNDISNRYIQAHLNDPSFRRWRAMGIAQNYIQPGYDLDLPTAPWPGPAPLPAKAVNSGPSENTACPYSGDPVNDYLELDGRIFGFCNPFCRDKTVADAAAWDGFMKIYQL